MKACVGEGEETKLLQRKFKYMIGKLSCMYIHIYHMYMLISY